MDKTLSLIQEAIKNHKAKNLYVAYSGGIDSTALLHLVSQVKSDVKIHSIHIHHGLSHHANDWLKHCQVEATKLNINFIFHKLIPPKKKKNIEGWARSKRYAFFKSLMLQSPNSLLLTAHHIDDQAETFLLQALRGNGIKGLSSIAGHKTFANGFLLRPCLHLSKHKLIRYCQQNNLTWVEDESNESSEFRRNQIRHHIMPILVNIDPSTPQTLARSAQMCAEADEIIYELLIHHLNKIVTNSNGLDLSTLNNHSILQQKYLLKIWLTQQECYPSYQQFLQIHAGTQNKQSNWQYQLGYKKLTIQSNQLLIIDGKSSSKEIQESSHTDILNWLNEQLGTVFNLNDVLIRQRQAGDRCRPVNRNKSQILKVIFQELGINMNERKKGMIITLKKKPLEIIAIHPFFVCIDQTKNE